MVSGGRDVEQRGAVEAVKDSYRARGAEVFHTAEVGAVRFELSQEGVKASTFRTE